MTVPGILRSVILAAALVSAACGATEEGAGVAGEAASPAALSPQRPAVVASPGEEGEVARFQRLSVEALRLMIEAAQRALPIGPVQDRINAARRLVPTDPAEAADQLEAVVADLKAMLEASLN